MEVFKMNGKTRKFYKKAISPLIAAVLLMALVVSIGAVIMTWTKTYVNKELTSADAKQSSEAVCGKDVSMSLEEINNEKQICWTKDAAGNIAIKYTLTNGPDKELIGLAGKVITSNKVFTNNTLMKIGVGQTIIANNTFKGFTDINDLKKFSLSAMIMYESSNGLKKTICQDHTIERTLIEQCS